HALVLLHPPRRRHLVLVPERVHFLVHQRQVTVHHKAEPRAVAGALRARDGVQVALEVVPLGRARRVLQVRRPARVHEQLRADVLEEGRRQDGRHDVRRVADAEQAQVGRRVEGPLELIVADARAGEGDCRDGDRDAGRAADVVAVGDDVDGVERGERGAQAVARYGDAAVLVLVRAQKSIATNYTCSRALSLLNGDEKLLDV
ncbi:Os01g0651866, partial [Oryza sativa Japonica Group]